jgi:hypothetical protein
MTRRPGCSSSISLGEVGGSRLLPPFNDASSIIAVPVVMARPKLSSSYRPQRAVHAHCLDFQLPDVRRLTDKRFSQRARPVVTALGVVCRLLRVNGFYPMHNEPIGTHCRAGLPSSRCECPLLDASAVATRKIIGRLGVETC